MTGLYVLTHHDREPLVKDGGTTFTFVTDGIESALVQAEEAAEGKDIALAGGADVAQQFLRAGLVDEMQLHVAPVLLGGGTRLLDNLEGANLELECIRVIAAQGVTHLKYRIGK
ncbi:MAG: dihydrofolate reductase family protein [Actinobacteria bacterium]|nr:dihydrofolate reductase family protein [Actinomycetota bacterium]